MRALIVSSTQPRHPTGTLPWVRASCEAAARLAREGCTLVTSLGSAPWDLVLCRAASLGAPVHLIAPLAKSDHAEGELRRIANDYGLPSGLVSWEPLRSARSAGRRKDTWEQRDRAAFEAADRVFPVCVKPGGRIDGLLRAHAGKVDDRFRIGWLKPALAPQRWNLDGESNLPAGWLRPALLHLTRSSEGPWPGESMQSYWADIARSDSRYPRDGFATLCRILEERRIRASRFRIRGGAATVSLTALEPALARKLLHWRSRFARYSFEPYAVAISSEAAIRVGARAVRYDDGSEAGEPDALHQGRGQGAHWEAEKEWRVEGDLELSRIDPSQLGAIAATDEEAAVLRSRFPELLVASFGAEANRVGAGGKGAGRVTL